MARYKDHSYTQGIMIPIDFTKQIIPGMLEHTIHWLADNKIDLSGIEKKYNNDGTGAPAYDPRILLKIVLLGGRKTPDCRVCGSVRLRTRT